MRITIPRAALVAALLSLPVLAGCHHAPSAPEIEAVSMDAAQRGDATAERRLAAWAGQGEPVAERELALLYQRQGRAENARILFERSARQGDAEAAFQLGELEHAHARTRGATTATAARWYHQAAEAGHAKAALMLALLLKNGEGIAQDEAAAAHWLDVSAAAGDAHAMFLLSNAYADGDGVAADPRRARALLEQAADAEYPAALQQLALVKQTGDALTAQDAVEARQLLQEGAEHRYANARRF